MRIVGLVLVCILQTINISAQTRGFTINGKLPSLAYNGKKVFFHKIDYRGYNELVELDSAVVKNDRFQIQGFAGETTQLRYITLEGAVKGESMSALLAVEPGVIDVDMLDLPVMGGTPKNDELQNFTNRQVAEKEKLEEILARAQRLHQSGGLADEVAEKLEIEFEKQKKLLQDHVYLFIKSNIDNEVGEFFFTLYASNLKPSELEDLYVSSSTEFQQSILPKTLMQQFVWGLGELREGQVFKGLEMKTIDNKFEDIAVNFGKGRVVLVDFWASWCGPCRKTMPALVAMHDRYKDQGFEVVGISLDENMSAWKAAIKSMKMNWPQYMDDGRGWSGVAARQYSISSIPQTYLLDKKGKIAAHNLKGVALIEKIEELLKEE